MSALRQYLVPNLTCCVTLCRDAGEETDSEEVGDMTHPLIMLLLATRLLMSPWPLGLSAGGTATISWGSRQIRPRPHARRSGINGRSHQLVSHCVCCVNCWCMIWTIESLHVFRRCHTASVNKNHPWFAGAPSLVTFCSRRCPLFDCGAHRGAPPVWLWGTQRYLTCYLAVAVGHLDLCIVMSGT